METNRAMDTDAPRLEVVAELGALAIGAGLFKRPRQSTARQREVTPVRRLAPSQTR
jgi:hypothetical protein